MGQKCISVTSCTRVKKTVDQYKLADQLYDIDEGGIARRLLTERRFTLDSVRENIKNSVTYWFVQPEVFMPGLDQMIADILDQFCKQLGVKVIKFTSYKQLHLIKDGPRSRNVLIHIIENTSDVDKYETPLFDIFACIDCTNISQSVTDKYIFEQFSKFGLLTKRAEYQETYADVAESQEK